MLVLFDTPAAFNTLLPFLHAAFLNRFFLGSDIPIWFHHNTPHVQTTPHIHTRIYTHAHTHIHTHKPHAHILAYYLRGKQLRERQMRLHVVKEQRRWDCVSFVSLVLMSTGQHTDY